MWQFNCLLRKSLQSHGNLVLQTRKQLPAQVQTKNLNWKKSDWRDVEGNALVFLRIFQKSPVTGSHGWWQLRGEEPVWSEKTEGPPETQHEEFESVKCQSCCSTSDRGSCEFRIHSSRVNYQTPSVIVAHHCSWWTNIKPPDVLPGWF